MTKQVNLTMFIDHENLEPNIRNHLTGTDLGTSIEEVTISSTNSEMAPELGSSQEPVQFGFEEV